MSATVHRLPEPPRASETGIAPASPDEPTGLRSRLWLSLAVSLLVVGGTVGWASVANIAGAVIAKGQVIVDSNTKKIQHPTGGIVGEILVRNGDKVEAGAVVVRLDDTLTRASLGVVNSQLSNLIARKARLEAEREGDETIVFPDGFESEFADSATAMDGERRYLRARRLNLAGQKAQLSQRIVQLSEEVRGLSAQRDAKKRELDLVRAELARLTQLYEKRLTPITRVLAMQRDEARIAGEHGALMSHIARSKGQITEIELQIVNIDDTVQTEAQKELREVESNIATLRERRVAAKDQLRRVEIRAPQTGIVHDLAVHTVGGVINAAEPLMLIVPKEDQLVVEALVAPADIDQIHVGQAAMMRFSAFNQRTTPEVAGKVLRVGADLSRQRNAEQPFYVVRLKIDEAERGKLEGLQLMPGMPVEVFVQTAERSALSYFLKPLTDQFARAFREE